MTLFFTAVLNEHFSKNWKNELLNYPLTFSKGDLSTLDLAFFCEHKQLKTQITDVEYYPSGDVKSLTAWVVINLKADEKMVIELRKRDLAENIPFKINSQDIDNKKYITTIAKSGIYAENIPAIVESIKENGKELLRGTVNSPYPLEIESEIKYIGEIFVRAAYLAKRDGTVVNKTSAVIYADCDYITFIEDSENEEQLYASFKINSELLYNTVTTEGYGHNPRQVLKKISYSRDEELAVIDFNSGHHQMSLSWFGIYSSDTDENSFVGAMELNGSYWDYLYINRLYLKSSVTGSSEILSPIYRGHKEWALVISKKDNVIGKGLSYLANIHERLTETPYNKLKDWVVDWDDEASESLYFTDEEIKNARQKLLKDERIKESFAEYEKIVNSGGNLFMGQANDYTTLWIATGNDEYAEKAAAALLTETTKQYNDFWFGGTFSWLVIFSGRAMKVWLRVYDLLSRHGFIDKKTSKEIKRLFALFAYSFADEDFFPTTRSLSAREDKESYFLGALGEKIGDAICPPNFATEYYTSYGCFAAQFCGHPKSKEWIKKGINACDTQLKYDYFDSGVYIESPNYHHHSFGMLNQFARCLLRIGVKDYYTVPRFKAQFGYFCDIATPPVLPNEDAVKMLRQKTKTLDYDNERFSVLPGNGNTGHNCSDIPLPIDLMTGALMYQHSDKPLADRCYNTWVLAGRPVHHVYDSITFLLSDIENYKPSDYIERSQSKVLEGSFVTMRGMADSGDEVYILIKNGVATHHNDFDEGGFTIWAYGSPLCGDYGYHADDGDKLNLPVVSTWQHNCVEFDLKSSGYLGMEKSSAPELFLSNEHCDFLISDITVKNLRDTRNVKNYLEQQTPCETILYKRYLLFVKPDYFLVYDNIISCPYTHRWWLHAQSESVDISKNKALFKGKFGVNLSALFITPSEVELTSGNFSVQQYITAAQDKNSDWRAIIHPHRDKEEKDFTVKSLLSDRVNIISCEEYTDTVMLSAAPFSYGGHTARVRVSRRFSDGKEIVLFEEE